MCPSGGTDQPDVQPPDHRGVLAWPMTVAGDLGIEQLSQSRRCLIDTARQVVPDLRDVSPAVSVAGKHPR